VPEPFDTTVSALGGAIDVPGTGAAPALSIDAQAHMVAGYAWIERRLFAVLGAWVGTEVVPEARLLFDLHSQQHAWHAELFVERLPVGDGDAPSGDVPPSFEVDRMFSALAGTVPSEQESDGAQGGATAAGGADRSTSGGTLLRLAALGRVVLPRLTAGYARHLRRAALVADAPLVRSLRLVLHDEVEQWFAVESLTQALVRRPHDVAVVGAHQQRLEQMVVDAGVGLVPWPHVEGAVPGSDEVLGE
jgi:hypothetical protein